jgi:hypothetical protein
VDNTGKTIAQIITKPAQFAYSNSTPVWDNLYALSLDVLDRWQREQAGETDVGRVLPKDYLWYTGDGKHNNFRNSYNGKVYWDYSLPSPYSG